MQSELPMHMYPFLKNTNINLHQIRDLRAAGIKQEEVLPRSVGLLCFVSKLLENVSPCCRLTVRDPHSKLLPATTGDAFTDFSLYSSQSASA